MGCGKFEIRSAVLLDDVCRIVGAGERLDKFWRVEEEGKIALLFGKVVLDISTRVMEEVGECIEYGWVDGSRKGRKVEILILLSHVKSI